MVTHQTTNRPACGLSTAERTGSPVFHTLWSYVLGMYLCLRIYCLFRLPAHVVLKSSSYRPSPNQIVPTNVASLCISYAAGHERRKLQCQARRELERKEIKKAQRTLRESACELFNVRSQRTLVARVLAGPGLETNDGRS